LAQQPPPLGSVSGSGRMSPLNRRQPPRTTPPPSPPPPGSDGGVGDSEDDGQNGDEEEYRPGEYLPSTWTTDQRIDAQGLCWMLQRLQFVVGRGSEGG